MATQENHQHNLEETYTQKVYINDITCTANDNKFSNSEEIKPKMANQNKDDNKVDSVLVALRRIIRATDIDSKNISRMVGLTPPQLMIMQTIRELGDVPIKSIAQEVNLTQATVTTILDRLEKSGMISRERGTEDRRKVFITITDKGFDLLTEAPKTLQDQFLSQFQDLHDWEQTTIIAALERVAHMMDAQHIDASPVLDIGAIDRTHA